MSNGLGVLQEAGFTVTKTFDSSTIDKFKKLESTFSILQNGNTILYVQDNYNGTFNTFGFNHKSFNVSIKEVLEIVKNKNNWCLVRGESDE